MHKKLVFTWSLTKNEREIAFFTKSRFSCKVRQMSEIMSHAVRIHVAINLVLPEVSSSKSD